MSETEINDYDCVLDEEALTILDNTFSSAIDRANDPMLAAIFFGKLLQKIKHINKILSILLYDDGLGKRIRLKPGQSVVYQVGKPRIINKEEDKGKEE